MGTPQIAIPTLDALDETTELVGVVCQPDRASGRGLKVRSCPVKQRAIELGVEVHQPVKVKTGNLDVWLKERAVELVVVFAYGRILPARVLEAPRLGCINLHASLLPKYRGAAPIQWALQHGENETGISLMKMDEGLDTGPVYCRRKLTIDPLWNVETLSQQLGALGRVVIKEDLAQVASGAAPTPQANENACHAPPITAEHCRIDWARSSTWIQGQSRAFSPRPGAFCDLNGKRFKVIRVALPAAQRPQGAPNGRVSIFGKSDILVTTGSGLLQILEGQLEGKRAMSARDLVNGRIFTNDAQLA